MDLLQRIEMVLQDEISTGDVAINTAQGKIDVIGGECPKGMVYDKLKKVCVPSSKNESSVSGMVAGSGQGRVWGERKYWMTDLDVKEPVENEMADKAKQNILGRKGLTFDLALGAYVPHGDTKVEPRYFNYLKGEDNDE